MISTTILKKLAISIDTLLVEMGGTKKFENIETVLSIYKTAPQNAQEQIANAVLTAVNKVYVLANNLRVHDAEVKKIIKTIDENMKKAGEQAEAHAKKATEALDSVAEQLGDLSEIDTIIKNFEEKIDTEENRAKVQAIIEEYNIDTNSLDSIVKGRASIIKDIEVVSTKAPVSLLDKVFAELSKKAEEYLSK